MPAQTETTTAGDGRLIIRPISPSTLIALTEPCLMDWCATVDSINIEEQEARDEDSYSFIPLELPPTLVRTANQQNGLHM
jgi:hypothetical protein